MSTPDTPCIHCHKPVMRSPRTSKLVSIHWAGGDLTESCAASETGHELDPWPTSEQFDAAAELGCNAALTERRNGNDEPQESPLSGEWADAPTARSIAESLGFMQPDDDEHHHEWVDGLDELGTAWERGYFDTWQHEPEVKSEEDAE